MTARGIGGAVVLALATVVAGVLLLWPAAETGPEPVAYGRDACAACRMPITRPGFGGELRDRDGTLTKYDDVGCLLRAMVAAHREIPGAWVEDHEGGGFVPLLAAHLVRAAGAETPMGYEIVAFADAAAAERWAAAHAGRAVALEDVLHDPPEAMARGSSHAGHDRGGTTE